MDKQTLARLKLISAMLIWGSIGLFVRSIALPSSSIAFVRALVGVAFIILVIALRRIRPDWAAIKRNGLFLLLSGLMLGFNWTLLFESYNYTTVAIGTLCYYMAPLFVVALSPILFKEKLNLRKLLCILLALFGMVFVSGVAEGRLPGAEEVKGILYGLGAAAFFTGIVCCNKMISGLSGIERTLIQLSVSILVLLPYNIFTGAMDFTGLNTSALILLLVVGIVHTGLAYVLYFGSMEDLPSQTVAILSYMDPVVAVLLSALVLGEAMSLPMALGAVLIIGAAVILELPAKQKK